MLNIIGWVCVVWVMFKIGAAQFILATGAHLVMWTSSVVATVMIGLSTV